MPLGLSQGIVTLHARAKVSYHWRKARWHGSNAPGFIAGDRYPQASKNLARPPYLPAGHQLNFRQTAQTSRLDAGGQSAYFFQKSRSGINTRQDVVFGDLRTIDV